MIKKIFLCIFFCGGIYASEENKSDQKKVVKNIFLVDDSCFCDLDFGIKINVEDDFKKTFFKIQRFLAGPEQVKCSKKDKLSETIILI
ncbi:hypothetical protein KAH94_05715 [bacterium]|nr:hypothetical protein [bacterium]